MNLSNIISLIGDEVERAETKWPKWPTDPIHAAAIVAEESGELVRAAVQWTYERGNYTAVTNEAIHTAATAIRFLRHLETYEPNRTWPESGKNG